MTSRTKEEAFPSRPPVSLEDVFFSFDGRSGKEPAFSGAIWKRTKPNSMGKFQFSVDGREPDFFFVIQNYLQYLVFQFLAVSFWCY